MSERREHAPAVSQLCRTLLRLERASATGTLSITPCTPHGDVASERTAHLRFEQGVPVFLAMDDEHRLGRFVQSPGGERDGVPCGAHWLRDESITRGELAHALRRQLRRRMAVLLGWQRVALRFDPTQTTGACLPEPIPARELVAHALRRSLSDVDRDSEARLRHETWRLRVSLDDVGLAPAERAMCVPLKHGATGEVIIAVGGNSVRALATLHAWQRGGLIEPARRGDHRELLRKRRQLRERANPQALLDLGPGATRADARRALRRLVRKVHPDRFEPQLARASEDVVRALVQAERAHSSVGNHHG